METTQQNKQTLEMANAAVCKGDYEGFLIYCTEDTHWEFIGEQVLTGKEAVRRYMAETYIEPPQFELAQIVAEGEYLTAVGKISLRDKNGTMHDYQYCDVWKFKDGKLHELKAFVVESQSGRKAEGDAGNTVIGSGFTYDEDRQASDVSRSIGEVEGEDIVNLPDLGQPNRP